MANVYVRSGAAGAGTGADWTNAYTTLSAALTAKAAGDDFWVSEDHSESTAGAVTLTSPGTLATPCRILCVNHAGSVPPVSADLATTGQVATTGANAINFAGVAYCYGLKFVAGDSTNLSSIRWNGAGNFWTHKNCLFNIRGTSNGSIRPGATATAVTVWDNCQVKFSATNQSMQPETGSFEWKNTTNAFTGGTIPSSGALISSSSSDTIVRCHGVDFSDAGSGKTLIAANNQGIDVRLENCKLNASVTKYATPTGPNVNIEFINCDSGGTNYKFEKANYYGTETQETTITRSGGASDGTQSVAKKIVTSASARFHTPFEAMAIEVWNNSTSAKTVTVYGVWGGGAVPNNDDIWIEVEYLGDASSPQSSFISTGKANVLASNAATTSDSSTWGGSTTKFKMVTASFTPAQTGPLIVRVFAGAASSTFYIDPLVVVA